MTVNATEEQAKALMNTFVGLLQDIAEGREVPATASQLGVIQKFLDSQGIKVERDPIDHVAEMADQLPEFDENGDVIYPDFKAG
ncbi:ABC-type uncharacterized transport system substrate-binding protein [Labrenzia sp. EL_126]|nr:ABC-type uncharacterized transport system substrate-binding protein [Labrenzia sp. EL_126]